MESPTRLSDVWSTGRSSSRASKKSLRSRLIYSDKDMGPRSVSLNTLPSNLLTAQEESKLAQLQTLEAKMASIAVSLSSRRRKSAFNSSLHSRHSAIPALTPHSQRSSAPALVVPVSPSLTGPALSSSSVVGGGGPPQDLELAFWRDREVEALKRTLQHREAMILSLQHQLGWKGRPISSKRRLNGLERRSIEERLMKLQKEEDHKRIGLKALRMALENMDVDDNLDARIRQAELEYQYEREEISLLNLQEEQRALKLKLEEGEIAGESESIFKFINSQATSFLVPAVVTYDNRNPPFSIQSSNGVTLDWVAGNQSLQAGDQILEINGHNVVGASGEDVQNLLSGRLELVILRKQDESALEKTHKEKEAMKTENIRLSHRISYLEEQVAEMQKKQNNSDERKRVTPINKVGTTDNEPKKMLREKPPRTTKLANSTTWRSETVVILDGGAKHVHEHGPQNDPSARTQSLFSFDNTQNSAPIEIRQRSSNRPDSPSETRSVISVDSDMRSDIRSYASDLESTRSERPRRPKPIPPRKPSFLYLNRAASLQSVDERDGLRSLPHAPEKDRTSGHFKWPSLSGFKTAPKPSEQWC